MTIQAIRTTCKYQTFPCKNFLLQIFRIDLTKRDARVREEFRWDWSSFIGSQSQTTREPSISSGIILLVAQARGSLSLSLPSYLSSSAGGEVVGVITLQCTGLTDVWCQGSEYSSAQDGGEESVFNQASIIDLGWLAG